MEIEVKSFSCIQYIPFRKELYIRDVKISLTNFECIFVNYLIDNKGYCNIDTFSKHILKICKRGKIFKKSLVVCINRLRKKIYYLTGEKVIKSKYGYGYYIDP